MKKTILERDIEFRITQYSAQRGVMSRKFVSPSNRSVPDRIFFIHGGKPLFVEFKRPGGVPTPLQAHFIETLRGFGYDVLVIDDIEQGKAAIDARLK